MYSSSICKESLINLRKSTSKIKPNPRNAINKLIKYIDEFVIEKEIEKARFYVQDELDTTVLKYIDQITNKLDQILSENKKFKNRDKVLDGYFELIQFTKISDYYNDSYRYVVEYINEDIKITQMCLDASVYIEDVLKRRVSGAVFFSATLDPLDTM